LTEEELSELNKLEKELSPLLAEIKKREEALEESASKFKILNDRLQKEFGNKVKIGHDLGSYQAWQLIPSPTGKPTLVVPMDLASTALTAVLARLAEYLSDRITIVVVSCPTPVVEKLDPQIENFLSGIWAMSEQIFSSEPIRREEDYMSSGNGMITLLHECAEAWVRQNPGRGATKHFVFPDSVQGKQGAQKLMKVMIDKINSSLSLDKFGYIAQTLSKLITLFSEKYSTYGRAYYIQKKIAYTHVEHKVFPYESVKVKAKGKGKDIVTTQRKAFNRYTRSPFLRTGEKALLEPLFDTLVFSEETDVRIAWNSKVAEEQHAEFTDFISNCREKLSNYRKLSDKVSSSLNKRRIAIMQTEESSVDKKAKKNLGKYYQDLLTSFNARAADKIHKDVVEVLSPLWLIKDIPEFASAVEHLLFLDKAEEHEKRIHELWLGSFTNYINRYKLDKSSLENKTAGYVTAWAADNKFAALISEEDRED